MSITEFIIPQFTKDEAQLQQLATVLPAAARATFGGVPGLLTHYQGRILQARDLSAGTAMETSGIVITLEWDQLSSFATFFGSDKLVAFKTRVKPFLVAPPVPELFRSDTVARSGGTTQSKLTQYVRVTPSSSAAEAQAGVEAAWAALVASLGAQATASFAAWGTHTTAGFAGLLGWDSVEDFEAAAQTPAAQKSLEDLTGQGAVQSYLLQLEKQ